MACSGGTTAAAVAFLCAARSQLGAVCRHLLEEVVVHGSLRADAPAIWHPAGGCKGVEISTALGKDTTQPLLCVLPPRCLFHTSALLLHLHTHLHHYPYQSTHTYTNTVWDNMRLIARKRFEEGIMPSWFNPEWLDIEEAPTNTWWRQQGLSTYRQDTSWLGENAPSTSGGSGGDGSGDGGSSGNGGSGAVVVWS